MAIDKILFKVALASICLSTFFISSYLNYERSDPYLTDKYYHQWLSGLGEISKYDSSTISQVVLIAADTIKAPEPIAHFLAFILTQALEAPPEYYLNIISIMILILFSFSISFKKRDILIQLALLFLITSFSYYWFVLFNITHRLKLAVLLLIISFAFAKRKSRGGASLFLIFSIFTHFSVFLIVPIIYILDRRGYVTPISSAYVMAKQAVLFMFAVIFIIAMSVSDPQYIEPFMNLIRNKTFFLFDLIQYVFIPVCLLVLIFIKRYELSFIYPHRLFFVAGFYCFILYYFGTSRLLMLLYIASAIIVFFNPAMLRISKNLRVNYIVVSLVALASYDTYKYISNNLM